MEFRCLYEDKELLVCVKPGGIPSQGDRSRDYDMLSAVKNHLALSLSKGGAEGYQEPYAALVHRLDRPVGGIMVFAKTQKAAAALSAQLSGNGFDKRYLAVVSDRKGRIEKEPEGMLIDYLKKDGRSNLSAVVAKGTREAKRAQLTYRALDKRIFSKEAEAGDGLEWRLVEIHLLTGRHHQIRVQMAEHFDGIWGDTKYHPDFKNKEGWFQIALYAWKLEFLHPITKKKLVFEDWPEAYPFKEFDVKR